MSRKSSRKNPSPIGTLLVELSALAGMIGIAQPNLRDNLWRMFGPSAYEVPHLTEPNSTAIQPQFETLFDTPFDTYAASRTSHFNDPGIAANATEYPSGHTARIQPNPTSQTPWNHNFSPMGGYQ